MSLIGYGRVSTADQNLDSQTDALTAAGVDRVFIEKITGTLASRPELDRALDHLRAGDVLVVTRLDRLGRSVKNLIELAQRLQEAGVALRVIEQNIDTSTSTGRMFYHMLAAIAEFEHDLIVTRTKDGLAAARARGRKGGRKPKMNDARIATARKMYDTRELTVQQIADAVGVSRATVYRYLSDTTATV